MVPRLRPLRLTLPLLLAVLVAGALGCSAEVSVGGDSEASGEEIAAEVEADYERETGIEISSLTCEDVESTEGEEFSCAGRNERGIQLEIEGEVTDTEADGFDYSWRVTGAVAPGVLYERALRGEIEARGVGLAEVRCPVEIEMEVGAEVRCATSDREGEGRGVTLTLTDLDGGFDYEIDGHGGEAGGHGEPEGGADAPAGGTQS